MAITIQQRNYLLGRVIPALLSGEYKQGEKHLRPTADTYCCLGVMADLVIRDRLAPELAAHWEPEYSYRWDEETDERVQGGLIHYTLLDGDRIERESENLPLDLAEFLFNDRSMEAGPECVPPTEGEVDRQMVGFSFHFTLAGANDAGRDFKEIADSLRAWVLDQDLEDE